MKTAVAVLALGALPLLCGGCISMALMERAQPGAPPARVLVEVEAHGDRPAALAWQAQSPRGELVGTGRLGLPPAPPGEGCAPVRVVTPRLHLRLAGDPADQRIESSLRIERLGRGWREPGGPGAQGWEEMEIGGQPGPCDLFVGQRWSRDRETLHLEVVDARRNVLAGQQIWVQQPARPAWNLLLPVTLALDVVTSPFQIGFYALSLSELQDEQAD